MKTKFISLILCFFSLHFVQAQSLDSSVKMGNERVKIKLTAFDLTMFSLPSAKIQVEYLIKEREMPRSLGLDFGYIFYSMDEAVNVLGYHLGGRYNLYKQNNANDAMALSFSCFGSETQVYDYLKLSSILQGTDETYHYYEKMSYTKRRLGIATEFVWQIKFFEQFFLETSLGLGIVNFQTRTPKNVTQRDYVNGITGQKDYDGLTLLAGFKLGYSFL